MGPLRDTGRGGTETRRRPRRRTGLGRTAETTSRARLLALSRKVESLLIEVAVALGVVLLCVQFLLSLPTVRYVMSYVDRLEGVALEDPWPSVTVVLLEGEPAGSAYLLVNGRRAAAFALGQVRVRVAPGDLLEVDGTDLEGEGVFEVVETRGGVAAPAPGDRVTTRGGVSSLGRVVLSSPGGGGD